MLVSVRLRFLEAKMKKKFNSDESYPIVVLYDEKKEQLIKPYAEEGEINQLKMLKGYELVDVEMDIYDGKNGMVCRLVKLSNKK